MEASVEVVRGKVRAHVVATELRAAASRFNEVLVDVGTGDGRWVYRLARARPDWFCLGIDANAAALREVSSRAGRKPARGGVANAWFLHASVEALPAGLERLADYITLLYPWGRLLDGMLQPDLAVIRPIALLGKPGADVTVCVNESALQMTASGVQTDGCAALLRRLRPHYAEGGITLTACQGTPGPQTTWGKRVGQGRPNRSVVLTGVIRGATSGRDQQGAF